MWEEKFPVLTSEGPPHLILEDLDRQEFDKLSLFFVRKAIEEGYFFCVHRCFGLPTKKEEEVRTKRLLRGDYMAKAASRVRKITMAAS